MTIDLMTVWPVGYDYPLFRKFIRENRKRFRRVIIVWTNNNNGLNLKPEIEEKMKRDDIAFMDCPPYNGDQDWRDVATRHALGYFSSDVIWFTEQDFEITNPEAFWDLVEKRLPEVDVLTIAEQDRMHPACLFMHRKALERTCKDFSVIKDEADHFSRIQKDIERLRMKVEFIPGPLWSHMNGLTHNLWLHMKGLPIVYKPEQFKRYLKKIAKIT